MASRVLVSKDKPSFKQQNLPAWQPILTASTVLPTFFLIAVAFVPIGIGLLMSSTTVQEISLDYTDCKSISSPSIACSEIIRNQALNETCRCKLEFDLPQDFRKQIYVYYGLSNFYQNHRRYVKSRDDNQLLGNPKSVTEGGECYPFDYRNDPEDGNKRKPIAPCGAIANSKFNDTFNIFNENETRISLNRHGIAWSSDKRIRFQNPPGATNLTTLMAAFEGTVRPPNWRKPVYDFSKQADDNGFQNEDLMVWMRTAALPTFRKLYAIVGNSDDQLPRGQYSLYIDYNYPVTMFNGRKRFIMSNTSWMGGKNNFLGIAYIVVGCICFIISAVFLFIHKKFGRLPSEIIQINQTTRYLAI